MTQLRGYGYTADMDMMGRSFKAQFKAVDRMKAHYALLIGNTEKENNQITIKDIQNRTQDTIDRDALIAYLDEKMGDE